MGNIGKRPQKCEKCKIKHKKLAYIRTRVVCLRCYTYLVFDNKKRQDKGSDIPTDLTFMTPKNIKKGVYNTLNRGEIDQWFRNLK